MIKLLHKEMKLTASILSYLFIAFGLITFCPGYPILVGSFFACFGIFQSFQSTREKNDIVYTALLPVSKRDVVKSKYLFCIFIECCYFLLTAAVTLIRMTALSNLEVYQKNALMNANLAYLGYVLLILGCFNAIFVCGFFKTAYKFSKPLILFIIAAFLIVGLGEALFRVPGLEAINSFGFDNIGLQLIFLGTGLLLYIILTVCSLKVSIKRFEKIDL